MLASAVPLDCVPHSVSLPWKFHIAQHAAGLSFATTAATTIITVTTITTTTATIIIITVTTITITTTAAAIN